MTARLRKFLSDLGDAFWLVPGALVLFGALGAFAALHLDRSGLAPGWLVQSAWLYNGGGTGARTLLGAVASSTIGVAGTVFSITIAALSLAAGQMGPRLLRNFTRDRGNQVTLGVLVGTFAYALIVLRSVRTVSEGEFVPHVALSIAILLALLSTLMLVYFVGHTAKRINVDTVVELVAADLEAAIHRLAPRDAEASDPPEPDIGFGPAAALVRDRRRGYLQHLQSDDLADWAAEHRVQIRLLVRPGDYCFPGAPIALVQPDHEGGADAIRDATALGPTRVGGDDLEYAVRLLVEVAVRALSPGINDPHTAISVIDRLGAALCEVAERPMPRRTFSRQRRPVLVVPVVDYDGLTDAMFHTIRQCAEATPSVLIRMLEVLSFVRSAEASSARGRALRRHADLVLADAERTVENPSDLADLRRRYALFLAIEHHGPLQAALRSTPA